MDIVNKQLKQIELNDKDAFCVINALVALAEGSPEDSESTYIFELAEAIAEVHDIQITEVGAVRITTA